MSTPTQTRDDIDAIPSARRPNPAKPHQPTNWALKVTMAITGAVFALYVLMHLFGNLKIFISKTDVDHYAHWLRTIGNPLLPGETFLWLFRIVLIVCFVLHVASGLIIRLRARKVRGPHRRKGLRGFANFRTRYMLVTGILLICFLIFHLMDLTFGAAPAASAKFQGEGADGAFHAGENLIASFQRPAVAIFYMIIMILLFLHLGQGLKEMVFDLGGTGKRLRAVWLAIAGIIALLVLLGNALIPFCVMIGVVK